MGLINGSLQIGKTAILAQQSVMQVIGNNIANAGNTDYTRQTAKLSPLKGATLPDGSEPGAGVIVSSIQRNIDEALEQRLRDAKAVTTYDDTISNALGKLETLYNEMTDNDLSTLMNTFFDAFSEVQADSDNTSARYTLTEAARSMANQIRLLRSDVVGVYDSVGKTMEEGVSKINDLTSQIAKLNVDIANASTGGESPSALMDQRDAMLKQLSEMADITAIPHNTGDVSIYLNGKPLVQYDSARQLKVEYIAEGELAVPKVRFADNNDNAEINSGTLGAGVDLVTDFVIDNLNRLDTLAASLIFEVNKIHSSGQGLVGYSETTSDYAVQDSTVPLDEAGLPFTPVNGTFKINMLDSNTGQKTEYVIKVDLDGIGADTTLQSLAADLTAIPGLDATVLANGQLRLSSTSDNYTFTFGEDTSHALATLGINSFFTGEDGGSIAMNDALIDNPQLVAAATNGEAGDGSNAEAIANLRFQGAASLNGITIPDYYRGIVSDLATQAAEAMNNYNIHNAVLETLQAQREAISGVNVDEETIDLLAAQRAFQGASRYISTVNSLMQEVLDLL
jgi:flagellar hook-associated protein 1 FlgK